MISTPARLTPRSRVRVRIISSLRISSRPYRRVLPAVRSGLISPSRSYRRSVCGWMLYRSAMIEIITYPSALRRPMVDGSPKTTNGGAPGWHAAIQRQLLVLVDDFRFDDVVLVRFGCTGVARRGTGTGACIRSGVL